MRLLQDFLLRRANAKKCVAQIKAGEWIPSYNAYSMAHLSAYRGVLVLWIASGGWFCEIEKARYFGLFWRHYVWWFGARQLKRKADIRYRSEHRKVEIL